MLLRLPELRLPELMLLPPPRLAPLTELRAMPPPPRPPPPPPRPPRAQASSGTIIASEPSRQAAARTQVRAVILGAETTGICWLFTCHLRLRSGRSCTESWLRRMAARTQTTCRPSSAPGPNAGSPDTGDRPLHNAW